MESRRLLAHALKLWRAQGNDLQIARTLKSLAYANLTSRLNAEGIPLAREASEVYERLNHKGGCASSLRCLAWLLAEDGQVDAAEEAITRANDFCSDEPTQPEHYHVLGHISLARGKTGEAISHHETALGIATSLNSSRQTQSQIIRCLVHLLLKEGRFDDAQAHLEFLKSDAANDIVSLGLAAAIQACVWRRQGRAEEAEAEIARVVVIYQKMGVPADFLERGNAFLRQVNEKMNSQGASEKSGGGDGGEFPERCCFPCPLTHRAQNPNDGGFPRRIFRRPCAVASILAPFPLPFQGVFSCAGWHSGMYPRIVPQLCRLTTRLSMCSLPVCHPHSALAYIVGCLFHSILLS